jgi:hypothetical protein
MGCSSETVFLLLFKVLRFPQLNINRIRCKKESGKILLFPCINQGQLNILNDVREARKSTKEIAT